MRPASVRFALLLAVLLGLLIAVPRATAAQQQQTQAKPPATTPAPQANAPKPNNAPAGAKPGTAANAQTPANAPGNAPANAPGTAPGNAPANANAAPADPNAPPPDANAQPVKKPLSPDRAHDRLLPPRNWMQKTYDIQYADVRLLARLIQAMQRGSSADRITTQPELRTLTIGTTNPMLLAVAEEVIKQYDIPPPNRDYEVIAYMLLFDRAEPDGTENTLPAGLEEISKQLQTSFGYKQVKLLDGAIVRAREGQDSSAQGLLTGFDEKMKTPAQWKMSYQVTRPEITPKRNAIAMYGFQFSLRIPTIVNQMIVWQDISFRSDVDITDGKAALVGHSKLGVDEKAIVVVLTARLVE